MILTSCQNSFTSSTSSMKRESNENANGPPMKQSPAEHWNYTGSCLYNGYPATFSNASLPTNSPMIGKTKLTPEVMANYLSNQKEYDCTISLFYPKVFQKSYKGEKRYFCPPPYVHIFGNGWQLKQYFLEEIQKYQQPSARELCVYIGIGQAEEDRKQLVTTDGENYIASKMIHISDSDKRKFLKVSVQVFYGCGIHIGDFSSTLIKVISKASKKKRTVNPTDDSKYLCIASGTKVALFNRTKPKDRFLYVENDSFNASDRKWGLFTIHLVGDAHEVAADLDPSTFCAKTGFIYYNSVIKIIDDETGIALPPLKIRKVDKDEVLLHPSTSNEPVAQLQKCTFEIIEPMNYLCMTKDTIVQHKATAVNEYLHKITEGAAWTIVSADKVQYRFFEAMGPVSRSITPVPIASSLEISGANSRTCITISGRNFMTNLTIWFGTTMVETIWRSAETLTCMVPVYSTVDGRFIDEDLEVAILLVRDDGVIYPTKLTFSYKNMHLSNNE